MATQAPTPTPTRDMLPLDDPGCAWVVTAGHYDVFAIECDDQSRGGRRHHLFRVGLGDPLLGIGQGSAEFNGPIRVRLVAVGSTSAAASAQIPDQNAVERWAEFIARVLAPAPSAWGDHPTIGDRQMVVGDRVSAQGRTLYSLAVSAGTVALSGGQLLTADHQPLAFIMPLWVNAPGDASISVAMIECPAAHDLAGLHAALFETLVARAQAAARQDDAVARLRAAAEGDSMALGLGRLAGLLSSVPASIAPTTACSFGFVIDLLCDQLGEPRPARQTVAAVNFTEAARTRGLRYRRVLLRGGWKVDSEEPLAGFFGPDQQPVALLPGKPWRMVGLNIDIPVDDAVEADLAPEAWQLYRRLPGRSLLFRDLFTLGMRHSRADTIRLAWSGVVAGMLGIAIPKGMQVIFDSAIPNGETSALLAILFALLAAAVATAIFEAAKGIALQRLEARFETNASPALMDRLLRLPARFFRGQAIGDLADRLLGIQEARAVLSTNVLTGTMGVLFGLSSLLLLASYDMFLALIAFGLALLTAATTVVVSLPALRQERLRVADGGKLDGFVLQLVIGITKIRNAAAEGRAMAEWAKRYAAQRERFVAAARWRATEATLTALLPSMATTLMYAAIAYFVVTMTGKGAATPFTVGSFVGFSAAFAQLMAAVSAFGHSISAMSIAIPLIERARPILETTPENRIAADDPGILTGRIDLCKVSFAYAEGLPLVLNEVDLRIDAGEYIALVGASGSGKSTIMRLLLGFEQADAGEILFDGKSASRLDAARLRAQFGVVLQNGRISAGSIYQNIVGPAALDFSYAWSAARMAGLDREILEMPMGMHTPLLDGGGTLSGGQRQRLLIARALVHRPRILLFDEATSALDNRTQAIVTQTLADLNITRMVIAHRLSTIASVDRIFVMEQGRVVESGHYNELISAGGPFAALARRQLSETEA